MVQRPVLSCHHFNKYYNTPLNQPLISEHNITNPVNTLTQQSIHTTYPSYRAIQSHYIIDNSAATTYRNRQTSTPIYNPLKDQENMEQPKPKKEKFRKYQYTKPFKERDKTKDFGKDLPLKKSGRLKFPEKPQYYTLYTVPKLKPDHPFFNIRNKDIADVKRAIEQTKKELEKQLKSNINPNIESKQDSQINRSSSYGVRSSAFDSSNRSNSSLFGEQQSNISSLGVVTISSKKSKENPFSQGFTVTSGPKVYSKLSEKNESRDVSKVNTPGPSVLSGKEVAKSVVNDLSLSGLSHLSI